jgi:hypothetical protein
VEKFVQGFNFESGVRALREQIVENSCGEKGTVFRALALH